MLEAENVNGPLSKGFHAFQGFDTATLDIERTRTDGDGELPRIYRFNKSKRELRYYKVNGSNCITNSQILEGELLLSITYKLYLTRDANEVYNLRQIYRHSEEIYIYLESSYCEFHEFPIDKKREKTQNLEGLLIIGPLEEILESFTLWLVEVDPIGFELLRRMNRDGFIEELSKREDLTIYHDSENLMDVWLNRMTNYADTMELGVEINTDNLFAFVAIQNAVFIANGHTKTDLWKSQLREEWVHPRQRDSNQDDADSDEDNEKMPDLTDEDIEKLRVDALARRKESEVIKFVDLPQSLQQLIYDLIQRVEDKVGEEDADFCSADIKGFIAGRYIYSQTELSSQIAKHLRMLT